MERFIFSDHMGKEKDEIIKAMHKVDDKKAYVAGEIAGALIEDAASDARLKMDI